MPNIHNGSNSKKPVTQCTREHNPHALTSSREPLDHSKLTTKDQLSHPQERARCIHIYTDQRARTLERQAEQDIFQEATEQNMRAVIDAWASPIRTLERYSSDDAFVQHGLHFNGHPAGSQGLSNGYARASPGSALAIHGRDEPRH